MRLQSSSFRSVEPSLLPRRPRSNPESHVLAESAELHCPACDSTHLQAALLRGGRGERFLTVRCADCGENGMLQCDTQAVEPALEHLGAWLQAQPDLIFRLQEEWGQWIAWKRRYAYPRHWPAPPKRVHPRWLLGILLVGLLWVLSDAWQVAGVWKEDVPARQAVIQEYVEHMQEIDCLPAAMRDKLATVPIHYTLEPAVHGNMVQYGEAGVYWGEEQIRVHRSNFWIGALPKQAVLIETLVHEARHRVSPALGHNSLFHQLVRRDVQCVLRNW